MKCAAYIPRPRQFERKITEFELAKRKVLQWEHLLWQAEKIGWPALADSFRRDIAAARAKVAEMEAGAKS